MNHKRVVSVVGHVTLLELPERKIVIVVVVIIGRRLLIVGSALWLKLRSESNRLK